MTCHWSNSNLSELNQIFDTALFWCEWKSP